VSRLEVVDEVIRRGIGSSEIRAEVDISLVTELLLSPLLVRMASCAADGLDRDKKCPWRPVCWLAPHRGSQSLAIAAMIQLVAKRPARDVGVTLLLMRTKA
jgi:hypothetical protein